MVLGILLLVPILLRSAHAATIWEPDADLRFELVVPGAAVCVILPRGTPVEPGCENINGAAIAKALGNGAGAPKAFALVIFPDWRFTVTVVRQRDTLVRTSEEIERYVESIKQGASQGGLQATARGRQPGTTYDLERFNGVNAIRTEIGLEQPGVDPRPQAPSQIITYTLVGQHGLGQVAFASDTAHLGEVRATAERAMQTVSTPSAEVEDFGKGRNPPARGWVGWVLGAVVLIVVAVVGVRYRQRFGRKTARP